LSVASGALFVVGGSGIPISLAAKLVEKLWGDQKPENADRGDSHGLAPLGNSMAIF